MIIPQKNVKELPDIPVEIKSGLTILPCSHMEEVLKIALDLPSSKFAQLPGLKVLTGNNPEMVAN